MAAMDRMVKKGFVRYAKHVISWFAHNMEHAETNNDC